MEFYSNTRRPERKRENFTNKLQNVYRKEIDKLTGERKMVVDKKVDIYEKIQEYAEETKISNILQRYNVDMLSRLKEGETQLVDLTNLPENLLEAMVTIDNAKYLWERQSKDIKARFDNDFKKFIAGSENGQIMDILQREVQTQAERFNTVNQAQYVAPQQPIQQPVVDMQQPIQQPVQQTQNTNVGGMSTNV